MQIRAARPEDHSSIVGVVDEWWGRPMRGLLPRMFLDHFHATSQVATDDEGLAGFLVAFVSPSQPQVGYLHFVGVRPDQRGGGLARGMYRRFAEYARRQGCRELHAITSPVNTASIAFHQRLGFDAREVADYDGRGKPMVTFRRPLAEQCPTP